MSKGKIGFAIAFIVILLWVMFPIAWMFNMSLQQEIQVKHTPPYYLPPTPSLQNYWFVLNAKVAIQERLEYMGIKGEFLPAVAKEYPRAIVNSITVALVAMGYNIIAALLAAYTFTRIKIWGGLKLFYLSVMGRLIPPVAIAIPYYIIIFKAGLLDNLFAVIMIHIYFTLPINIWILNTYFGALPEDIEDAARVDGYSRLETLFRVVFPVIKPALVAIGIIAFMFSWGEFFFTFIITKTEIARTLPVIIGFMSAQPVKPIGILSASGIIAMIPALVVVAIFRRHLIRGLVAGAVR